MIFESNYSDNGPSILPCLYIKQLGLKDTMHKRRRRAKMAFQIYAMPGSPDTTTKGGGPHVFLFLISAFVFEL